MYHRRSANMLVDKNAKRAHTYSNSGFNEFSDYFSKIQLQPSIF